MVCEPRSGLKDWGWGRIKTRLSDQIPSKEGNIQIIRVGLIGAIMCLFSWRVYVLVMVMLLLFDRLVKWSVAWLSYDRVFLTVTSCLVSCVYLIYLSFTELIVLKPNMNVNNRQWTTKKKLLTIDVGPEVVFSSVLCMWMTRFSITTSFSYQVLSCIRPTKH